MCGIVGLVAKDKIKGLTYTHRKVFQQMVYIDAVRGEDSTGTFLITKKWDVSWAKQASMPEQFFKNTQVTSLLNKISYDGVIAVGHNRKATFGKVTDDNAHPFVEDKVILVHNGTLKNHKELNKEVEVDSHAIAHAIKEDGIRKAIKRIDGAFAIAAADVTKEEFYLIRNAERPLFIGETDDLWLFASEAWMLFGVASREGISVKNIKQLEVGRLYTFKLNDKNYMEMAVTPVKLFSPAEKSKTPIQTTKVVQPAPKVVEKPAGLKYPVIVSNNKFPVKKGGSDIVDFINRFPKDRVVCFRPNHLAHLHNQKFKIMGVWDRDPSVAIEGFLEGKIAELQVYLSGPVLYGYVRNLSADSALNKATVFLHSIGFSDPHNTLGDPIDEEDAQDLSGQCHQCGGNIEEEGVSLSFFRRRKDKHSMICPACVVGNRIVNPKWGKE